MHAKLYAYYCSDPSLLRFCFRKDAVLEGSRQQDISLTVGYSVVTHNSYMLFYGLICRVLKKPLAE